MANLDKKTTTFGMMLFHERNKRRETQEQFAKYLGMPRSTITKLESGSYKGSRKKTLERISEKLGIDIKQLEDWQNRSTGVPVEIAEGPFETPDNTSAESDENSMSNWIAAMERLTNNICEERDGHLKEAYVTAAYQLLEWLRRMRYQNALSEADQSYYHETSLVRSMAGDLNEKDKEKAKKELLHRIQRELTRRLAASPASHSEHPVNLNTKSGVTNLGRERQKENLPAT